MEKVLPFNNNGLHLKFFLKKYFKKCIILNLAKSAQIVSIKKLKT